MKFASSSRARAAAFVPGRRAAAVAADAGGLRAVGAAADDRRARRPVAGRTMARVRHQPHERRERAARRQRRRRRDEDDRVRRAAGVLRRLALAAASVGYSEAQQDKMRKDKKPIRRKLGAGEPRERRRSRRSTRRVVRLQRRRQHLLLRHYAPERTPARGEPDPAAALDPEEAPGVTAIVRELATGRDTTFGNVGEAAWQTKGRLLAIAIAAEDRAGNGVQVFDPARRHAARARLGVRALPRPRLASGRRRPRRPQVAD